MCLSFCILTQILPRTTEGKFYAPLPSSTSFGYSCFAVVLFVISLVFLPVETCRMVETGIVQCYVCGFQSKVPTFENQIHTYLPHTWGSTRYSIAWPQTPVVR